MISAATIFFARNHMRMDRSIMHSSKFICTMLIGL